MSRRNLEVMVGAFVLLGLGALLFVALKAANLTSAGSGREGYRLQAKFDNIGGLKARAPVRAAGVSIGRVRSIDFDPKTFQAVVTLEVNREVEFPKDTSAKILTAGLLGDSFIGLEAGGDTANLKPGDTITQTQSAVVLESLIGQFLFNKAADAGGTAAAAPAPTSAPTSSPASAPAPAASGAN